MCSSRWRLESHLCRVVSPCPGSSRDVGDWLGRAHRGHRGMEAVCRGLARWAVGTVFLGPIRADFRISPPSEIVSLCGLYSLFLNFKTLCTLFVLSEPAAKVKSQDHNLLCGRYTLS